MSQQYLSIIILPILFYHNCCILTLWMLLQQILPVISKAMQCLELEKLSAAADDGCSTSTFLAAAAHSILCLLCITSIMFPSLRSPSASLLIVCQSLLDTTLSYSPTGSLSNTLCTIFTIFNRNFPIFLGLFFMFWRSYYSRKYSRIFCMSLEMMQIYLHNVGSNIGC